MNQNVGENQVPMEAAPLHESGNEKASGKALERGTVSSPENSPQTQSVAVSSQVASDIALPAQATAAGLTDDNASSSPSEAGSADNTDRIEKQWVDKAKTVIERTKDDPYEQKIEMSKVKAEYIHKRFNKTIRADDTVVK